VRIATTLRPVAFRYNATDEPRLGLIAEEVGQIEPRLIFTEEDGTPRGVRYEDIVAVLLAAFQKQHEQLTSLLSGVGQALEATFTKLIAREIVVENLTATRIGASESITAPKIIASEMLCLDDVCVTKEQLREMIRQVGQVPTNDESSSDADLVPDEVSELDATSTPAVAEPVNEPVAVEEDAPAVDANPATDGSEPANDNEPLESQEQQQAAAADE
jgi:hypothetical protein